MSLSLSFQYTSSIDRVSYTWASGGVNLDDKRCKEY